MKAEGLSIEKVPKPESIRQIPRNYCRYGIKKTTFEKDGAFIQTGCSINNFCDDLLVSRRFQGNQIEEKYYGLSCYFRRHICTLCPEHALNFSGADYILKIASNQLRLLQSLTGNSNS